MTQKQPRKTIGKWWKIDAYSPKIEPVEIVAFTGSFVTFLEKRWTFNGDVWQERRQRRDDIFPTFMEAKDQMLKDARLAVDSAKSLLHRRRTFLGMVESLKEPNARTSED